MSMRSETVVVADRSSIGSSPSRYTRAVSVTFLGRSVTNEIYRRWPRDDEEARAGRDTVAAAYESREPLTASAAVAPGNPA